MLFCCSSFITPKTDTARFFIHAFYDCKGFDTDSIRTQTVSSRLKAFLNHDSSTD